MGTQTEETKREFFSPAYIEEAVSLGAAYGGKWTAVQKEMASRHPEERAPHVDTIKMWSKKYESIGTRASLLEVRENPEKLWGEVELMALTKLLDGIRANKVGPRDLYVIAGVAADKRLKALELDRGKTRNIRFYGLIEDARKEVEKEIQLKTAEYQMIEAPDGRDSK